jgi:CheY-like chemotaxis protein
MTKAGVPAPVQAAGEWTAGTGCVKCGGLGFKGRLAIHEVLALDDEIRAMISSRTSEQEIRMAARRAGMRTLLEDGLDKAARGLTTLEEVLSVTAAEAPSEPGGRAADAVSKLAEHIAPTSVAVAIQAEPAAPVAAAAPASGPGRRVLIVEDSPTVVAVVKYFLELEGFEVLVAGDGRQGLEMALAEQPDMIVSDVSMPLMTGVEMVRALRADSRSEGIRILMLTSEASVESEAQGLDAGADDYILKPVEPRRLAARVKALLGRPRGRAA